MSKIILARHGQDEDNAAGILNGRRDKLLTQKGISQAFELAENIKKSDLKIGLVISSNMQRAMKTAEICSKELGVPHIVLDYLVERSHGILEGHPFSDIPVLATKYHIAYGMTYVVEVEGGEGYPDLIKRASEILHKLKEFISESNIDGDVLVISHGAISKAMIMAHNELPLENLFDTPSFGNCEFRILK